LGNDSARACPACNALNGGAEIGPLMDCVGTHQSRLAEAQAGDVESKRCFGGRFRLPVLDKDEFVIARDASLP
jgi:hypothetical protein